MATHDPTAPAGAHLQAVPVPPEALGAEIDRAAAFGRTRAGEALTDAEEALYTAASMLAVTIRSIENQTAEDRDYGHEVEALQIALERVEHARNCVDPASTAMVRS